jgi:hypothetical protein
MDWFLAILITVPTAAALLMGCLIILGSVVMNLAAGVQGVIVALRHRFGEGGRLRHTPYGSPALHH